MASNPYAVELQHGSLHESVSCVQAAGLQRQQALIRYKMPPKAKGKGEVNGPARPAPPKWGRVKTNFKMGVVGLPNVGKSSLFNLLTEQGAAA